MVGAPLQKKEGVMTFTKASRQSRHAAPVDAAIAEDMAADAVVEVAVESADDLADDLADGRAAKMEAFSAVTFGAQLKRESDVDANSQDVLLKKLNAIREARDAGELELASKLIGDLLMEYPALALPEDLVAFKK